MDKSRELVASSLMTARRALKPVAPVRSLLPDRDLTAAYAVQAIVADRRVASGELRVGRKIGATSPGAQKALGVGEPNSGILFDVMRHEEEARVDVNAFMAPRIEGEVAFLIGADIMSAPADLHSLAARVRGACAALEIVDSAILGWDVGIVDAIADNGCAAGFVVGGWRSLPDLSELSSARMTLVCDAKEIAQGGANAMPGGPLEALAWLARDAVLRGDPLRKGEIVMSGALASPVPMSTGAYELSVSGFSPLRLHVHAGQ